VGITEMYPRTGVLTSTAAAAPRRRGGTRTPVLVVDLVVIGVVTATAAATRTSVGTPLWGVGDAVACAVLVALLVAVALPLFGCWDERELGRGREEYARLVRALASAVVVAALLALAVKESTLRPWVFVVLPLLAVALLAARWVRRAWTRRARRHGRRLNRVLVAGGRHDAGRLVARARRVPEHGWLVVGACVPDGRPGEPLDHHDHDHDDHDAGHRPADVAVAGDLAQVASLARTLAVDEVVVAPGTGWTGRELHRLAWELERSEAGLVLEPGLMEVTGPRLRVDVLDGLPLLRLHHPRFRGGARIAKSLLDRGLALAALVVLLPALAAITVAVAMDGGSPFYRQERIGRDGKAFRLVKFRSMAVGADRHRQTLSATDHDGAGPLFKLREDPRVTRVGRWLRRYSLDELPQLGNVLAGSMSLVGPRPPLPAEVHGYDEDARRRLRVPPGMTGLWQVSGRSDLSWEESVRLDLRYVENWSPALDLSILARTVGAVLSGRGAY
jgi:exopolysaccharide biosynthesis polyprenyl glycosylphosphotransferase